MNADQSDKMRRACLTRRRFGAVMAGALPWPAAGRERSGAFTDLMLAFWPVYLRDRALPSAERIGALMRDFFTPNAATYAAAGFKPVTAARLERWLPRVDPLAADMRRLHLRFAASHDRALRRFVRAFPDFDRDRSPMTLMPSLLSFDAHLEPAGEGLPLFFGLDGIIGFHGKRPDLSVLFAHEIFHCYQGQKNPAVMGDPAPAVFTGLWVEGGATWVSEHLNPQARPLNILLDDQALAAATPEAVSAAARALRDKFDSTEGADLAAFFSAGYSGAWPARVGYLIGLNLARRIGPAVGLTAFAQLPRDDMRRLYWAALNEMIDKA